MTDDRKRQNLPRGLWVVATPIGNLGDLTDRARMAFETADVIFCEDTRRTSQMLMGLGISTRGGLERLDAHSSPERISSVVERLGEGRSAALVTDAGTPGISDPGAELVAAVWQAGLPVIPVPGASAVAALLSVAGISDNAFTFRGFFPRKQGERKREIEQAAASKVSRVFVWYESPQRIKESLHLIAELSPLSIVFAGKELTKLHEKFFRGSAAEVAAEVAREVETEGALGEWCFVLHLRDNESSDGSDNGSEWVKALHCLMDARVAASEASRLVSQYFGIPKNAAYEQALRLAGKK